jgi:hypothetical protein
MEPTGIEPVTSCLQSTWNEEARMAANPHGHLGFLPSGVRADSLESEKIRGVPSTYWALAPDHDTPTADTEMGGAEPPSICWPVR